jgi:hypothetical protein
MENGIVLSRQDLPKTRVATEKEKDVWQLQRPKCDLHTTFVYPSVHSVHSWWEMAHSGPRTSALKSALVCQRETSHRLGR